MTAPTRLPRRIHPLVRHLTVARQGAGWAPADVAVAAGTRVHRLNQWESGQAYPTVDKLHRWAHVLGRRIVVVTGDGRVLTGGPVTALARHRRALGMSQARLAAGFAEPTTQSQISDWEVGRNVPGLWQLTRWADALGCALALVPAVAEGDRQEAA